MKKKIQFKEILLTTLKKYTLTLVGSLILIVAWYFEKISIAKFQETISEKKRALDRFQFMIHDNTMQRGILNLTETMRSIDSNAVSPNTRATLLLNAILSSILTYNNGRLMFAETSEDRAAIHNLYSAKITYLTALHAKKDIIGLYDELYRANDLINNIDSDSQSYVNSLIYDTEARQSNRGILYLLFYAIGIILITADKSKTVLEDERKIIDTVIKRNKKN